MVFVPNGLNKLYTENSEIWIDGHFINGKLYSGKVFIYDRDGVLLKVRVYKNGVYDSDGVL
jgi:antitoxin component YwqK of YwqJK toxin-antitoxin module